MQTLFILVALLGTAYFLFARRQFDYFTLAFFSALIYFLPGFFGATAYSVDGQWGDWPIHPEAYGIMVFVTAAILTGALVAATVPAGMPFAYRFVAPRLASSLLGVAACAGLIGLLLTAGDDLYQIDKQLVLESLNRWHILAYSAATLGFVLALQLRQVFLAGLCLALLAFDLAIGFRPAFSMAMLSVLALALHARGRQRLIPASWPLLLIAIVFGFSMFAYKHVVTSIKLGLWDIVWSTLTDTDRLLLVFARSEPFIVQQSLNEVVSQRFSSSWDHVISGLYQLMIFAPEAGAEVVSFNSVFQPALFPEIDYGIASNIWAQMWSAGGWPLLIAFVGLFVATIAISNTTLRAPCPIVRAGLAPIICYWLFYIHRNDLGYALNLGKRHLLLLAASVAVAVIVRAALRGRPAYQH